MLKFAVYVSLIFTLSCLPTHQVIDKPVKTLSQSNPSNLIKEGDAAFSKMHLFGWREAEQKYQQAYRINQKAKLRDKLFLTYFLIITREWHEEIINPAIFEKVDQLGDFPRSTKQDYLYQIITHCRGTPARRLLQDTLTSKEKIDLDISIFDMQNSTLDAYLALYLLQYFYSSNVAVYNEKLNEMQARHQLNLLLQKYSESPLFIHYFNFDNLKKPVKHIEIKFPQFAEYLVFKGYRYLSGRKYKSAETCFTKALQLLPDYTRATNGLGKLYSIYLKNYPRAIAFYQDSLSYDPRNPVAQFGKGISFHYLKDYRQANEILYEMLKTQDQYHGHANYFIAYNHYHLGDFDKAREYIDKAKSLLPYSGEVHFLSGLLFYRQGKMNQASKDFTIALNDPEFSPCYAYYYLGFIKIKLKNPEFHLDFKHAISCFNNRLLNLEDRIKKIEIADLREDQKARLKRIYSQELQEFRRGSQNLTQQMEYLLGDNRRR